jgi:hypothetical protein
MRELVINGALVDHTFIGYDKEALFSLKTAQKFNKFNGLIKAVTPVNIEIPIGNLNHIIED